MATEPLKLSEDEIGKLISDSIQKFREKWLSEKKVSAPEVISIEAHCKDSTILKVL